MRKYATTPIIAPNPTIPSATDPTIVAVEDPLDIIDEAKPNNPPVALEPTEG